MGIDQGKAIEAGQNLLASPLRFLPGLKKLGYKKTFLFGAALYVIGEFMLITLEINR